MCCSGHWMSSYKVKTIIFCNGFKGITNRNFHTTGIHNDGSFIEQMTMIRYVFYSVLWIKGYYDYLTFWKIFFFQWKINGIEQKGFVDNGRVNIMPQHVMLCIFFYRFGD